MLEAAATLAAVRFSGLLNGLPGRLVCSSRGSARARSPSADAPA